MNNLIKSPIQKEIVILYSALTQLRKMHNYCVMELPKNQVMFKTDVCQKYYFILLIDFLSQFDEKIKKNASLLDLLQDIEDNKYLGSKTSFKKLGSAVKRFKKWLNYEDKFKKIWLPDIDKEVKLVVSREDLIRICANMNKHAFLKLSRIRKNIKKIFEENNICVSDADIILCMENLYEWFYKDFLTFYSTVITQHLIDIQWGVYEYLLPLYKKSYKQYYDEKFKHMAYKFVPPKKYDISNGDELFSQLYWDLMNKIRSKPIFMRYKTPWYFKKAKV